MVCDPLSCPTTRISSPVGRRRSQRLQRTLILISAITKSSRHSTLGRTRICNTFLHLTSTHACRPAYSAPAQVQVECHQTLMQSPDITLISRLNAYVYSSQGCFDAHSLRRWFLFWVRRVLFFFPFFSLFLCRFCPLISHLISLFCSCYLAHV